MVEGDAVKRIAMWSGPRNISTAMMYSFDSRPDCFVSDEPFYAHYLAATGIEHPVAEKVIAEGETDWRGVAGHLSGDVPDGSPIWYQKHMCHHMIEDIDLDWLDGFANCFLIRDPREVVLSLAKKTDVVDAWATGLPQQARLVAVVEEMGQDILIVDSRDILLDPKGMLTKVCTHLRIPFDESMLNWKAGPKDCDGIWAEHWYDAVWDSTGFATYRPREGELPAEHQAVFDEVRPIYEALHARRLV